MAASIDEDILQKLKYLAHVVMFFHFWCWRSQFPCAIGVTMFSSTTLYLELIVPHAVSSCYLNTHLKLSDFYSGCTSFVDAISTSCLSSVFHGLTKDPKISEKISGPFMVSLALRFSSAVLWHAFFMSEHVSTCSTRLLFSRKPIQIRQAVGALFGSGDMLSPHGLQLVLQTVLVLMGLVGLLHGLVGTSVSFVAFIKISSKISYSSAKASRTCMVFWFRSYTPVISSVSDCFGGAAVPTVSFLLTQNLSHSLSHGEFFLSLPSHHFQCRLQNLVLYHHPSNCVSICSR